uniref:Uncharacterized protein n=1 Tax=Sphaerodactylus townsendi TaxID=933632 RepID=A0ACB8F4G2_9SAUR
MCQFTRLYDCPPSAQAFLCHSAWLQCIFVNTYLPPCLDTPALTSQWTLFSIYLDSLESSHSSIACDFNARLGCDDEDGNLDPCNLIPLVFHSNQPLLPRVSHDTTKNKITTDEG